MPWSVPWHSSLRYQLLNEIFLCLNRHLSWGTGAFVAKKEATPFHPSHLYPAQTLGLSESERLGSSGGEGQLGDGEGEDSCRVSGGNMRERIT